MLHIPISISMIAQSETNYYYIIMTLQVIVDYNINDDTISHCVHLPCEHTHPISLLYQAPYDEDSEDK